MRPAPNVGDGPQRERRAFCFVQVQVAQVAEGGEPAPSTPARATSLSRTNVEAADRLPQRGTPPLSAVIWRDTAKGSAYDTVLVTMPVTIACAPAARSDTS